MSVKVEYLLANLIWRVQRPLFRRRREERDRQAADCRVIARGGILTGQALFEVQDFAFSMWMRALWVFFAVFAVMGPVVATLPSATRSRVSHVLLVPMVLMGVCAVQVIPIVARRNWTMWSANRRDLGLRVNPREERRGLPRARDFWVALAGAAGLWTFVFYGSSHWNH
jgi:hypothetical protein